MEGFYWAITFIASAICTGTGMMAWRKNPGATSTKIFLTATLATTIAMFSARIADGVGEADVGLATAASKMFASSVFLSTTLFWQLTLTFPIERAIRFKPPNLWGAAIVAAIAASIGLGLTAQPDFHTPVGTTAISQNIAFVVLGAFVAMALFSTVLALAARKDASAEAMHSATLYVIGLWMVAVAGVVYAADVMMGHRHPASYEVIPRSALVFSVTGVMLYFATLMIRGTMTITLTPQTERLALGMKSAYKLLHRHVYLVEESKPYFSMKLFVDTLKGRCYDCESNESFACESLDCGACRLPCPCRSCQKYKSRTQGLMVTRLFPKDVRTKFYLQTTPIVWLSTVAGPDSMDPAKLSVLTDFLVGSMEKVQNGAILVDGIEYLITSNDFPRVLRAIDRWTEVAMTSPTRLIISLDPNAFDKKELAMLERNKEVVRPEMAELWRTIPERI
jgi:hypothetical protein